MQPTQTLNSPSAQQRPGLNPGNDSTTLIYACLKRRAQQRPGLNPGNDVPDELDEPLICFAQQRPGLNPGNDAHHCGPVCTFGDCAQQRPGLNPGNDTPIRSANVHHAENAQQRPGLNPGNDTWKLGESGVQLPALNKDRGLTPVTTSLAVTEMVFTTLRSTKTGA